MTKIKGIEFTQSNLLDLFNYNPKTGVLTNKYTRHRRAKINQVVGSKNNWGYLQTSINYKLYLVHRIIWVMLYGAKSLPREIDHKDGNTVNNKETNIRNGENSVNAINKLQTKLVGVRLHKGSYEASIKVKGKLLHLGCFKTQDGAIVARKQTEVKYGYDKIRRAND